MCYSLDNSRKFWNSDSKFSVTDHQQALYQINSIMDDDQLGPKTVAMENGVYIISMSPNSHWVLQGLKIETYAFPIFQLQGEANFCRLAIPACFLGNLKRVLI